MSVLLPEMCYYCMARHDSTRACLPWPEVDRNKVRTPLREETTRWATHYMCVQPERYVFILAGKWSNS